LSVAGLARVVQRMKGVEERGVKTPRSEVSASLRDLNSGSSKLPWTSIILYGTLASGQRAVIIGLGVVCSKDANGCSGRGVHKHAIAAKIVSKRLGAGGVGKRASVIGPALTGVRDGATRRNGIGSGGASGKWRQLTQSRCARASAQHPRPKILRRGGVNGRVVTNNSMSNMNIRAGDFAAWRVAWLCVGCWIARHVTGRVVGAGDVSA
jgi:hypothetical protein